MNKTRREALDAVRTELENQRSIIEDLQAEEQDYLDNMPESFQQGDKGEAAGTAIDAMESAVDALSEAMAALEEAQE